MRKFTFKLTLALSIFALSVFISSCGSDDPVSPGGGTTTTSNINGTIVSYPGGITIVRARATGSGSAVVATDTVLANGQFDMNLVTPPANILGSIRTFADDTIFTVTDTTAFYAQLGALEVYSVSDTLLGTAIKKNFDTTIVTGSFAVTYLYVDRNVSITGTRTSISGSDTSRIVANLTLVTGWNVVTSFQTTKSTNLNVVTVSSGEQSGATWRFQASPAPPRVRFYNNRLLD
jgi:hypothetical protein